MITLLLSPLLHARRFAVHLTALVGVAGLVAFSSAQASVRSIETDGAVAGDPFGIVLIGYNTTDPADNIGLIVPGLSPTFGGTQTFTGDALGGQTLTVTSSQTGTGANFLDTITISVPTNFVPAGTTDGAGNVINGVVFAIGTLYGGTSTLDFDTSLAGATFSGYTSGTFLATTSLAGVQNPELTNNDMSLSNQEGVFSFVGNTTTPLDISAYAINEFTFTISVPEPSTYAAVLLGAARLCWLTVVRRRARR